MFGTMRCIYETPCHWCSKWDKKCDEKIPERGQRVKCNPVDDTMDDLPKEALANKMCVEESDHEWECCGISTVGTTYICKKCHAYKTYPCEFDGEISVTI